MRPFFGVPLEGSDFFSSVGSAVLRLFGAR